MAGLNIDKILSLLERQKTAEEIFADGLQDVPVAEPVAQTSEETPVIEEAPTAVEEVSEVVEETPVVEKTAEEIEAVKLAEMEKEAAELDAKGRIMARAFMSELEKLASERFDTEGEAPETSEEVETEKVAEDPRVWILTNLYNSVYNG